jgi:DNA gyrase/topoisomerase IV subunit A
MAKNKYGDENIPDVDLGPLAMRYMCLFGVNINLQRAIPMVQDGLKPVQRRFLYQMYMFHRTSKVRVNVIMGDLMKLHPHGDQGLGDTIARMCQPFTNNIPLVEATGNAGNVTSGDDAAAPRYLDIYLPKFTLDALFDEFDGKVSMKPSYDDTSTEPFCLPAKFPLILVNGTAGIGYTLSSEVPPFNLSEVADATIKLLKNPDAKIKLVPDLPTGCDVIVVNDDTFVMQSSFELDMANYVITIKNTPYLKYLEKIDNDLRALQESPNKIPEILSAEDESELLENDFRYVIRCSPCNLYKILDTLFKRVPGFRDGISTRNMVVVDTDFMTKKFNTRQILSSWIQFRLEYKRGWFLRELVEKTHRFDMLKGVLFMLSPKNLDKTIKTVRACKSKEDIIPALVKLYDGEVTTSQANYVAEKRLWELNSSAHKKVQEEMDQINEEIVYIREIVNDPNKIKDVIIGEIKEIKDKYGCPRKSKILNLGKSDNVNIGIVQILLDGGIVFAETENPEHLASDVTPVTGDEVCLIDEFGGFLKVNTHKVPHDKPMTLTSIGKNVMGKCVAAVSNQSNNIIMLTNKGRIKYMPISRIPSNATRKPLIPLGSDEYIVTVLEVPDKTTSDILIYTNDGLGKRIQTKDLNKVTSVDSVGQFILSGYEVSGMFCINSKKPYLVYVTRLGRIRLNHSKFLITGKKFADPKPIITLSPQDDLIAVFCVDKEQTIVLNHADTRTSTIHVDTLPISTMSIPPERPKHVPGVKVIRATLS